MYNPRCKECGIGKDELIRLDYVMTHFPMEQRTEYAKIEIHMCDVCNRVHQAIDKIKDHEFTDALKALGEK